MRNLSSRVHCVTFQKTVIVSNHHENLRFMYFLNHLALYYPSLQLFCRMLKYDITVQQIVVQKGK